MERTVLLTGGSGFVGGHLRDALRDRLVVLMGRKTTGLLPAERQIYVDLQEPVHPDMLAGGGVLCHLAYSAGAGRNNIALNRHLLDAVNASPNIHHVVFMSTTSVYGASHEPVVDEQSACRPVGEYAETKLACEKLWREDLREDCLLTVLRPTEVIGPGGKGLLSLIHDATKRPVVGAVKRTVLYHRPLHYVAVSNVVSAVLFCLDRPPDGSHELYVVSDDHQPENASYAKMQDMVRRISGLPTFRTPAMPRGALEALAAVVRRPLEPGKTYSSRKLHDAGFEDAVPLREEIRRVVAQPV